MKGAGAANRRRRDERVVRGDENLAEAIRRNSVRHALRWSRSTDIVEPGPGGFACSLNSLSVATVPWHAADPERDRLPHDLKAPGSLPLRVKVMRSRCDISKG